MTTEEINEKVLDANTTKDILLSRLIDDGLITEDQFEKYSNDWQFIVIKRSWFKRWKKIFGREEDAYSFQYVKFKD